MLSLIVLLFVNLEMTHICSRSTLPRQLEGSIFRPPLSFVVSLSFETVVPQVQNFIISHLGAKTTFSLESLCGFLMSFLPFF